VTALAVTPARGGSKVVPGKNVRFLVVLPPRSPKLTQSRFVESIRDLLF